MREILVNAPLERMSLSFAGCGFLGIYHVGVASCFREYCPQLLNNKIAGASAGALVATAMALNLTLAESTSDILKVAIKARSRALGPFHPSFDVNKIVKDALIKSLPDDCHLRVNGKLFISVTRVSDGKNCILSNFDSKTDLIQALLCSCFIPCFSGIVPPKFRGVAYMDGGLSDNLPILDDYSITVSPFSGESDICPQDSTFNYLQINIKNTSISLSPGNLYRITRILFPPHPEIMSKMCEQGFNDALKFLQRNNKISCLRCLAIQSSFLLSDCEEEDEEVEEEVVEELTSTSESGFEHSFDDCGECRGKKGITINESLPDPVARAIKEATDSVNKGLINWVFKHRPIKILSLMTAPYLLPFDITIALAIKFWQSLPLIEKELKNSLMNLIAFATKMMKKIDKKKSQVSAKFSCELAITEFDYSGNPKVDHYPKDIEHKKRKQFLSSEPFTLEQKLNEKGYNLKLDKSHSFTERGSEKIGDIKSKIRDKMAHRKSYAGSEFISNNLHSKSLGSLRERRKSMADLLNGNPSERVIQKMNFGFVVDLPPYKESKSELNKKTKSSHVHESSFRSSNKPDRVLLAFKSLGGEVNSNERDINAVEMTNKALSLEKEYFENCAKDDVDEANEKADTFKRIMEVTTNNEALMAFYYLDEHNRVKVTEIFNIPDKVQEKFSPKPHQRHTDNRFWNLPTQSEQETVETPKICDTDEEEDGLSSFHCSPNLEIDQNKN